MLDAEHGLVVERVALVRPRQPQDRDVAPRSAVSEDGRLAANGFRGRLRHDRLMRRPTDAIKELKHLIDLEPHRCASRSPRPIARSC